MAQDLLFSILYVLGAVLVTVLCWSTIGKALHMLARRKLPKGREAPLGFVSADAEKRRQTENADVGVRVAVSRLAATPIIFGVCYLVLFVTGAPRQEIVYAWSIAGFLGLCGFAFLRYRISLRKRRDIQWHHEAKAMVDKAIAPLIPRGYILFRDFRDDDMSIDHLLIGPKGVFALQTLVRSTNLKQGDSAVVMVTYDGRTLYFPQGEDHTIIEQAGKNADYISEWISKRLGLPIAARGIVALPGWQVKRTSAQGISVINPAQLEALFQYIKPWPLSEDTLYQIVRLVENHYGTSGGIPIETVAGEGLPS